MTYFTGDLPNSGAVDANFNLSTINSPSALGGRDVALEMGGPLGGGGVAFMAGGGPVGGGQ